MKHNLFALTLMTTMACPAFSPWATAQALLGPGGYSENFDSMGAAGTVAPVGWQILQLNGASGTFINNTGSNSTPAVGAIPNGVAAAGGVVGGALTVNNNPTGNQVNGYNALGASGAAPDRGLATAPTGIAASVIQLSITNNSGVPQNSLLTSYDIRRYQVGADNAGRTPGAGIPEGSDELPGYWLFYSLDNGVNFTAVDALIPVGTGPATNPIVPNTVGVTSVAGAINLGGPLNAGANLILRWVDDNAIDPSPDQIIGLDNVTLRVVPEPSTLALASAALMAIGCQIRRRRAA
ncbi:PEP-CTERM sorting domain-containing protein [Lacipirellula limnantheis]|uniref:PEP-CTERM motif protein n=1 Tax=Lacipirellula limnantheis TaxID=2528024 RepID=A0A517TZB4_9BACT|nr:PEP-CTERM sorting domain-containing protein [Lacipirellula limnantheis]QDT73711.1 PEP-CTERM motif protein [Lacipirellula limnantheis]